MIVAIFFAWLVPLVAIAAGMMAIFAGLIAADASPDDSRPGVAIWAGGAIALLGLFLTAINIWELF